MSDRKDWGKNQRVTQAELDAAFAYTENDRKNLLVDNTWYGIVSGLVATLGSAPTVNVTKGVAYDKLGRRIPVYSDAASTKNFSFANATDGTATSVTAGNERWISVYARFGRQALDGRVDGDGNPFYFDQPEVLHDNTTGPTGVAGLGGSGIDKVYMVAGASAATGTATRPALHADALLICDIKRTPSDASNVLDTTRRELGLVQAFTSWLGGRTNPAAGLSSIFDRFITDLSATTASDDGAERIGAQANGNLPSGSVRSQLDSLDNNKGSLSIANTWSAKQSFTGGGTSVAAIGYGNCTDGTLQLLSVQGNSLDARKWRTYACMTTTTVKGYNFKKGTLIFTWNIDLVGVALDVGSTAHSFVAMQEDAVVFGTQTAIGSNWQLLTFDFKTSSGAGELATTLKVKGAAYEVGIQVYPGSNGTHGGCQSFRSEYDSTVPSNGGITQDTTITSATNAGSISVTGTITRWGFNWSFNAAGATQIAKSARLTF